MCFTDGGVDNNIHDGNVLIEHGAHQHPRQSTEAAQHVGRVQSTQYQSPSNLQLSYVPAADQSQPDQQSQSRTSFVNTVAATLGLGPFVLPSRRGRMQGPSMLCLYRYLANRLCTQQQSLTTTCSGLLTTTSSARPFLTVTSRPTIIRSAATWLLGNQTFQNQNRRFNHYQRLHRDPNANRPSTIGYRLHPAGCVHKHHFGLPLTSSTRTTSTATTTIRSFASFIPTTESHLQHAGASGTGEAGNAKHADVTQQQQTVEAEATKQVEAEETGHAPINPELLACYSSLTQATQDIKHANTLQQLSTGFHVLVQRWQHDQPKHLSDMTSDMRLALQAEWMAGLSLTAETAARLIAHQRIKRGQASSTTAFAFTQYSSNGSYHHVPGQLQGQFLGSPAVNMNGGKLLQDVGHHICNSTQSTGADSSGETSINTLASYMDVCGQLQFLPTADLAKDLANQTLALTQRLLGNEVTLSAVPNSADAKQSLEERLAACIPSVLLNLHGGFFHQDSDCSKRLGILLSKHIQQQSVGDLAALLRCWYNTHCSDTASLPGMLQERSTPAPWRALAQQMLDRICSNRASITDHEVLLLGIEASQYLQSTSSQPVVTSGQADTGSINTAGVSEVLWERLLQSLQNAKQAPQGSMGLQKPVTDGKDLTQVSHWFAMLSPERSYKDNTSTSADNPLDSTISPETMHVAQHYAAISGGLRLLRQLQFLDYSQSSALSTARALMPSILAVCPTAKNQSTSLPQHHALDLLVTLSAIEERVKSARAASFSETLSRRDMLTRGKGKQETIVVAKGKLISKSTLLGQESSLECLLKDMTGGVGELHGVLQECTGSLCSEDKNSMHRTPTWANMASLQELQLAADAVAKLSPTTTPIETSTVPLTAAALYHDELQPKTRPVVALDNLMQAVGHELLARLEQESFNDLHALTCATASVIKTLGPCKLSAQLLDQLAELLRSVQEPTNYSQSQNLNGYYDMDSQQGNQHYQRQLGNTHPAVRAASPVIWDMMVQACIDGQHTPETIRELLSKMKLSDTMFTAAQTEMVGNTSANSTSSGSRTLSESSRSTQVNNLETADEGMVAHAAKTGADVLRNASFALETNTSASDADSGIHDSKPTSSNRFDTVNSPAIAPDQGNDILSPFSPGAMSPGPQSSEAVVEQTDAVHHCDITPSTFIVDVPHSQDAIDNDHDTPQLSHSHLPYLNSLPLPTSLKTLHLMAKERIANLDVAEGLFTLLKRPNLETTVTDTINTVLPQLLHVAAVWHQQLIRPPTSLEQQKRSIFGAVKQGPDPLSVAAELRDGIKNQVVESFHNLNTWARSVPTCEVITLCQSLQHLKPYGVDCGQLLLANIHGSLEVVNSQQNTKKPVEQTTTQPSNETTQWQTPDHAQAQATGDAQLASVETAGIEQATCEIQLVSAETASIQQGDGDHRHADAALNTIQEDWPVLLEMLSMCNVTSHMPSSTAAATPTTAGGIMMVPFEELNSFQRLANKEGNENSIHDQQYPNGHQPKAGAPLRQIAGNQHNPDHVQDVAVSCDVKQGGGSLLSSSEGDMMMRFAAGNLDVLHNDFTAMTRIFQALSVMPRQGFSQSTKQPHDSGVKVAGRGREQLLYALRGHIVRSLGGSDSSCSDGDFAAKLYCVKQLSSMSTRNVYKCLTALTNSLSSFPTTWEKLIQTGAAVPPLGAIQELARMVLGSATQRKSSVPDTVSIILPTQAKCLEALTKYTYLVSELTSKPPPVLTADTQKRILSAMMHSQADLSKLVAANYQIAAGAIAYAGRVNGVTQNMPQTMQQEASAHVSPAYMLYYAKDRIKPETFSDRKTEATEATMKQADPLLKVAQDLTNATVQCMSLLPTSLMSLITPMQPAIRADVPMTMSGIDQSGRIIASQTQGGVESTTSIEKQHDMELPGLALAMNNVHCILSSPAAYLAAVSLVHHDGLEPHADNLLLNSMPSVVTCDSIDAWEAAVIVTAAQAAHRRRMGRALTNLRLAGQGVQTSPAGSQHAKPTLQDQQEVYRSLVTAMNPLLPEIPASQVFLQHVMPHLSIHTLTDMLQAVTKPYVIEPHSMGMPLPPALPVWSWDVVSYLSNSKVQIPSDGQFLELLTHIIQAEQLATEVHRLSNTKLQISDVEKENMQSLAKLCIRAALVSISQMSAQALATVDGTYKLMALSRMLNNLQQLRQSKPGFKLPKHAWQQSFHTWHSVLAETWGLTDNVSQPQQLDTTNPALPGYKSKPSKSGTHGALLQNDGAQSSTPVAANPIAPALLLLPGISKSLAMMSAIVPDTLGKHPGSSPASGDTSLDDVEVSVKALQEKALDSLQDRLNYLHSMAEHQTEPLLDVRTKGKNKLAKVRGLEFEFLVQSLDMLWGDGSKRARMRGGRARDISLMDHSIRMRSLSVTADALSYLLTAQQDIRCYVPLINQALTCFAKHGLCPVGLIRQAAQHAVYINEDTPRVLKPVPLHPAPENEEQQGQKLFFVTCLSIKKEWGPAPLYPAMTQPNVHWRDMLQLLTVLSKFPDPDSCSRALMQYVGDRYVTYYYPPISTTRGPVWQPAIRNLPFERQNYPPPEQFLLPIFGLFSGFNKAWLEFEAALHEPASNSRTHMTGLLRMKPTIRYPIQNRVVTAIATYLTPRFQAMSDLALFQLVVMVISLPDWMSAQHALLSSVGFQDQLLAEIKHRANEITYNTTHMKASDQPAKASVARASRPMPRLATDPKLLAAALPYIAQLNTERDAGTEKSNSSSSSPDMSWIHKTLINAIPLMTSAQLLRTFRALLTWTHPIIPLEELFENPLREKSARVYETRPQKPGQQPAECEKNVQIPKDGLNGADTSVDNSNQHVIEGYPTAEAFSDVSRDAGLHPLFRTILGCVIRGISIQNTYEGASMRQSEEQHTQSRGSGGSQIQGMAGTGTSWTLEELLQLQKLLMTLIEHIQAHATGHNQDPHTITHSCLSTATGSQADLLHGHGTGESESASKLIDQTSLVIQAREQLKDMLQSMADATMSLKFMPERSGEHLDIQRPGHVVSGSWDVDIDAPSIDRLKHVLHDVQRELKMLSSKSQDPQQNQDAIHIQQTLQTHGDTLAMLLSTIPVKR